MNVSFSEAFILALPSVIIALVGVILQARREKNKPRVDDASAYAALTNALQTSGKTIDDLFKMLAEVPDLKQQVEDMQDELDELRLGVGILTAQLVRAHLSPEWKPRAAREKPIGKSVKASGFWSRR